MQLRTVIELAGEEEVKSWFMNYDLHDYLTQDEIDVINERGTWSKEKLAQRIVDHYYMYEIGLETIGLFKHQAKVLMQELMEEKLPLIYSAAIKYDPLVNVDFTETFERENESQSNSSSSNASSGLTVNSDTPQGQINKSEILQGKYATSTGANETENNIQDQSKINGTENYVKKTKGNSGVSATAQKMIEQYRENIVMINRDIIKDISSLFMGIY